MSLEINLSKHPNIFALDSLKLVIDKKINFIFGKNGTGKTTIADEIEQQFSKQFNVQIFKDFDGVAVNERLDAVALGKTNVKIQKSIDSLDDEISLLEKEVKLPDDASVKNLYTQASASWGKHDRQSKKITNFFRAAAREIKNLSDPQIAKPSYFKNDFENDILNAALLSENEIAVFKKTINSERMNDVNRITFPKIKLSTYLDETNNILKTSIKQAVVIAELEKNVDKQAFARQGVKIHNNQEGEICSFCGNEISPMRWQLLGDYFNNEVKKFENDIDNIIDRIKSSLSLVDEVKEISSNIFYERYADDVKAINSKLVSKCQEYTICLERLYTTLQSKKANLFTTSDTLMIDIPDDFSGIGKEYENLANKNNKFSKNIDVEQERAKNALRLHEVKKRLDQFNYNEEQCELTVLKTFKDEAKASLDSKIQELEIKSEKRKNLMMQTQDEERIAVSINKLLSNMGVSSFSLELVIDEDEDQKGQYRVRGYDNQIRPVTHLSKGEKNIISFLYFMLSLDSIEHYNKPKIVVLDDPMTSNDDTMQYLMISEIQKLFNKMNEDSYLLILTHNCHFYLNVRPNKIPKFSKSDQPGLYTRVGFYEKYGIFHFNSNGKQTTIKKIRRGKEDFNTNYEALWKELAFLYNSDTPDLMLNPCRRICETYLKFSRQDVMEFYQDNLSAKKLFDVNQHSIDDLEADQNCKTKEEIIDILEDLFKKNNAEDHFISHWTGGKN